MLSRNGKNDENGNFNWADALIDSAIVSGLTFCTSLGGQAMLTPIGKAQIISAGLAAATQFFLFLAVKRGLREKE